MLTTQPDAKLQPDPYLQHPSGLPEFLETTTRATDQQSPRLNITCLLLPNLCFLIFTSASNSTPPILDAAAIFTYFLLIPVALFVLLLSRTNQWKAAAKRTLVGLLLPHIIIPFLPVLFDHP